MRTEFTTLSNGLNRNHVISRLWEKAKKLGTWNPDDIDLSKDKTDWGNLSDSERDLTLNVATLFLSGEEAVTLDLLPLLSVVTGENRLEEEMYLTSFLWEEAKHVDFFHRYLDTVMTDSGDLSRYHTESYRAIFYETLPKAMALLKNDKSPQTQAEASVTYNIVVEGILAETGYNGWYQILQESGLLPGMLEGIKFVQRDESRHLCFGVYFISRLVAEHGDSIWDAVEKKMETLLMPAIGVINELFDYQEAKHGEVAFGLKREDFVDFAVVQFQKRMDRIEKSRELSLEDVMFKDLTEDFDPEPF